MLKKLWENQEFEDEFNIEDEFIQYEEYEIEDESEEDEEEEMSGTVKKMFLMR